MKIKILLIGFLFAVRLEAKNVGLSTPAYLSNPYFLLCKQYCPTIDYGSYSSLDMDCLQSCMDLMSEEI